MFELSVAVDKNNGIGYNGDLPWYCKEELQLFKNLTLNNAVVFGSRTIETLPKLENREIYCLTKGNKLYKAKNFYTIINHLDELLNLDKKVIIAGGAKVYETALSCPKYVDIVHISVMKKEYRCDTYFNHHLLDDFVIIEEKEYDEFIYYKMQRTNNGENQYLRLLSKIIEEGKLKNGRNGNTISLFTEHFKFDLRKGFPLLTTKKMFLRGIIEEFLFFLRGETDSTILSEKNVRIWEGNTTEEFIKNKGLNYAKGVMGPMYGYQWRNFGAPYTRNEEGKPIDSLIKGIDQLENVINLIKTDPNSRRVLMTSYNPSQAEEGVLYPCHSIAMQFYVDDEYLDMFCFNRSQDTFLGVPYNIASSSLLLMLVAKLTDKIPRFFNMTMGDTHLYEEHITVAKKQLKRTPYKFPTLILPNINNIDEINNLKYEDFILENYKSYDSLKAKMIA
jgi:dihydrofolate reductase/thymidylate synthase